MVEQGEPVYQEIGELLKEKKRKRGKKTERDGGVGEVKEDGEEAEPAWAPKPSVIYSTISAKEVARFVPCTQALVVRPGES